MIRKLIRTLMVGEVFVTGIVTHNICDRVESCYEGWYNQDLYTIEQYILVYFDWTDAEYLRYLEEGQKYV